MASRRRVDDSEEPEEATALDLRPSSRSARPADPPPPARKPPVPAPSRRVVDDVSSEDDGEATEFLAVRPASKVSSPAKQSQLPSAPSPRSLPSAPHTPAPVVEQPRGNRRAVPLEGRSSQSQSQSMEGTAPLSTLPPAAPSPRPLPSRGADSIVDHTGTASIPRVTRIHVVNKGLSTAADDGVHGLIRADDDDVERTLPPESAPRAPAPPPPAPVQRPKKPATMVDIVDDETQAPEGFDPDGTQAPDRFIDDEPAPPALSATGPMPLPLPPAPLPTSPQAARAALHDVETAPLPTLPPPAPKPRPKLPVAPQVLVLNDGVLVVEAPADASITVNGVDRGRGVVRVSELDREARHAVRIHAPGFQPWSGSVSLQGKAAAKIKPTLKPRAR